MMTYIRVLGLSLTVAAAAQVWGQAVNDNWLDNSHSAVQDTLQHTADGINSWFGPTEDGDARVKLRVMLDNRWNEYDGYSLRPRVRGSVRLPALENRLSVEFGDERLEYEQRNPNDIMAESRHLRDARRFSFNETRRDNSSLGLNWSAPSKDKGFDADLGVGIRSGGDIYTRAKMNKTWYHRNDWQTFGEVFYRYGLKSKHYVRGNWDFSHVPASGIILSNQLHIDYRHSDDEEGWGWGNSLSRKHMTGQNTWFNYGVYAGGSFEDNHAKLNTYGPFAGLRMNVYRNWFFVQPEITYYNDKKQDRDHHLGAMLRLEAQF